MLIYVDNVAKRNVTREMIDRRIWKKNKNTNNIGVTYVRGKQMTIYFTYDLDS